MKAGVLFSGGKDSSLAAIMLSRDYEVELNTFVFSPARDLTPVEKAAENLGFPYNVRLFKEGLLERAIDMIIACGYPNDAINMIHREAIDMLCGEYSVVADGTRLNDRVPMLGRGEVQALWDTRKCSYVRPLLGFGKAEVSRLAEKYLVVEYGETGTIGNGDYERELREAMASRGLDYRNFFPERHSQSLVLSKSEKR